MASIELTLFADYRQIHVLDEHSSDDLGDAWTDVAVIDRVAVAESSMAIGTEVNVSVSVTVDVLAAEPEDDSAAFDHVVEASIVSPSGSLVVMGCTDYLPEARRFAVAPGWVRVRASRDNLAVARAADVASGKDDETMERVRVQIWPAKPDAPAVVRRWDEG